MKNFNTYSNIAFKKKKTTRDWQRKLNKKKRANYHANSNYNRQTSSINKITLDKCLSHGHNDLEKDKYNILIIFNKNFYQNIYFHRSHKEKCISWTNFNRHEALGSLL